MHRSYILSIFLQAVVVLTCGLAAERELIEIRSSHDGTMQPCYVIFPEGFDRRGVPRPLLVSLHSWSADVQQRNEPLERLAAERGWIYLFPNFRGPNDDPLACGSPAAQQDVLDAVAWAQAELPVDARRIYLTGVSGGGHMAMLMAGRHPRLWAAASAWVGISDLAAWHKVHQDGRYGMMMRQVCGGVPGDSPEVDAQYRRRSPLTYLAGAVDVPIDLAAGIHDGHQGSVPIAHSIWAFNALARAAGGQEISDEELGQLSRPQGRLADPRPSDRVRDPVLGRAIYLRRQAGRSRLTIFEGGHEGIAAAAVDWLARHERGDADCKMSPGFDTLRRALTIRPACHCALAEKPHT